MRFQATARSAPEREREISNLVRKAEFNADPFAHEFGIAINPAMTEVFHPAFLKILIYRILREAFPNMPSRKRIIIHFKICL